MTRFWWVRHGPTHAKTMVGWSDLPADLSDSARLARLRAHLPATATVIASDLCRASATADAIQGSRPRLPDDPALREMHFGDWELLHFKEIEARDPDRVRAFWTSPGDVSAPNGESWNQTQARVSAVVNRLAAEHSGGDVVIVAHFGVILTQVALALQVPPAKVLAQRIDNLSVTRIDIAAKGPSAGAINHVP